MKVSKQKLDKAWEYIARVNKTDLKDLDLSEFGIYQDEKMLDEWRFVGLNNEDFISTHRQDEEQASE